MKNGNINELIIKGCKIGLKVIITVGVNHIFKDQITSKPFNDNKMFGKLSNKIVMGITSYGIASTITNAACAAVEKDIDDVLNTEIGGDE